MADPCELDDIANENPGVLNLLLKRIKDYDETAVKPLSLPVDTRGFPKYWNYVWTNFGDYI
jgi:hypothetical protein